MNMTKKLFLLPILALAACNNAPEETVETSEAKEVKETKEAPESATYAVNTDGDEVSWYGYKTYAEGEHKGTLQVQDGQLRVENGELTGGEFTLDMQSIHSTDLADDEENYNKLVGHLKSDDFFAVDSFPTAKFVITDVQEATSDTTDATHNISGNLTMRGQTKNITIPAKVDVQDDKVSLSTPEFAIDRSKWNVRFGSRSFGDVARDKAIDNNIKLSIDLEADKA